MYSCSLSTSSRCSRSIVLTCSRQVKDKRLSEQRIRHSQALRTW